jgi:hypothetical protein
MSFFHLLKQWRARRNMVQSPFGYWDGKLYHIYGVFADKRVRYPWSLGAILENILKIGGEVKLHPARTRAVRKRRPKTIFPTLHTLRQNSYLLWGCAGSKRPCEGDMAE